MQPTEKTIIIIVIIIILLWSKVKSFLVNIRNRYWLVSQLFSTMPNKSSYTLHIRSFRFLSLRWQWMKQKREISVLLSITLKWVWETFSLFQALGQSGKEKRGHDWKCVMIRIWTLNAVSHPACFRSQSYWPRAWNRLKTFQHTSLHLQLRWTHTFKFYCKFLQTHSCVFIRIDINMNITVQF